MDELPLKKARYFKKLDDGVIQCNGCARHCSISEGATGFCGVRYNNNGQLYLLNYGRTISMSIDPIEKKPLYHFFPGENILSISSLGCNFNCSFCQNWDISQFSRIKKAEIGAEKTRNLIRNAGYELSPEEIVDYCVEKDLKMIAYTYNEPAISLEYYLDVMRRARKKGIRNVWVTNGYWSSQSIDDICQNLDAANIDLKAFSEKFYKKHCRAKLSVVKDNISEIFSRGIWIELTTLVIPDENDSDEEITKLAEFIYNISPEIPLHLSKFHPAYRMLDKPVTPTKRLLRLRDICLEVGLKFVYVGNCAPSQVSSDSLCPNCGTSLVNRDNYKGTVKGLKIKDHKALCKKCSAEFPGIF
ncbi:AmmeMemoRadiSam system radical SAM enzyme [Candidatus Dojkabacteria bacterium]|nr:AmmeMemoRadiSam system radical SAM enzyme [Candidatus Dojkabacteria bacterium]